VTDSAYSKCAIPIAQKQVVLGINGQFLNQMQHYAVIRLLYRLRNPWKMSGCLLLNATERTFCCEMIPSDSIDAAMFLLSAKYSRVKRPFRHEPETIDERGEARSKNRYQVEPPTTQGIPTARKDAILARI
jgi:hypothetical protein